VCARCEGEVQGDLLGALLSEGSERVSAGSRKRSGAWGRSREMRDVGASTTECVGRRLGRGGG
jgi:hypothetical protein